MVDGGYYVVKLSVILMYCYWRAKYVAYDVAW